MKTGKRMQAMGYVGRGLWSHARALALAMPLILSLPLWSGVAQALDIAPETGRHIESGQTIAIGKGGQAQRWRVYDLDPTYYGGDGKLVWALTTRNPVPSSRKTAEAWYSAQVSGALKALAGEAPAKTLVSVERAGAVSVEGGPPFAAEFNAIYNEDVEYAGKIYVLPAGKGQGRLVAFVLTTSPGDPHKASAEFARQWSERLARGGAR